MDRRIMFVLRCLFAWAEFVIRLSLPKVHKNSCSTSLDDYLDEFENGEVEKGDDTKRNDELEDARKYSVPKTSMIKVCIMYK